MRNDCSARIPLGANQRYNARVSSRGGSANGFRFRTLGPHAMAGHGPLGDVFREDGFLFSRLKELGKFIDDMEAVKADIESDDPDLEAHGLERLASLALDAAEKFRDLPGGNRAVDFLRSCARDMLAERQRIIDARDARSQRMQKAIDQYNRNMARINREDDQRRVELAHEAEHGEQPDMFGVWSADGRSNQ